MNNFTEFAPEVQGKDAGTTEDGTAGSEGKRYRTVAEFLHDQLILMNAMLCTAI